MKNSSFRVCLAIISAIILLLPASAQIKTNSSLLRQAAVHQAEKQKILYQKLVVLAKERGWQMVIKKKDGGVTALVGLDGFGMPLYLSTDNVNAAATIGTNKLWPGGSTGLNLSGSSNSVKGKLAIWDGGNIRATHVELTGRINQKDNAAVSAHSTHVAGTLIASGVNPLAKGMSFGQQQLIAYNFVGGTDLEEMMLESPNLLISNHSYGYPAGWQFEQNNRWEYYGPPGSTEDFKFGYYSVEAEIWDSIAYNAPYYLIVKSVGNNRSENGPAVGAPYWRRNLSGVFIEGNRPAGISNNDSYDILSTTGTTKNILVVGAVFPITNGYVTPQDVELTPFSSWGPTDDGRIKPDVVADGVSVLSSVDASDNSYAYQSGTSMSSPNAAGSLLLLQEYYAQLHPGTFMRSATLKGIVIHTANEAGPSAGPDYQHGWGLINMQKAAAVITANNTTHLIREGVLNNGATFSLPVIASGNGTLSATLSWTDPKAVALAANTSALNNSTRILINDLDIVIRKGATIYQSWTLNPLDPGAAALRGDNSRDNVEKIELPDVVPGDVYTIEVTHKGILARGSQAYSLIVSGVGSAAYCSSGPTSNAGARIDSVSVGTIRNKNVAGCTTYSNFTNLTGNVEPGQTLPLFVRLNSCDATSVDKMVKVYIDANNDGDFTDANETLATSIVINGNGDFNTNITIPVTLTTGKYTILRIVMQETNTAVSISPCGSYTRGETQDYRLLVSAPSTDVGITELLSPQSGECASGLRYATVRIRNFGTSPKSNVPVTVVIMQGATTIVTRSGVFPGTIPGGGNVVYTLQVPFVSAANTTYTVTSTTSLAGDQNLSNNQHVETITTSSASTEAAGTATICGTTGSASLRAIPPTPDVYTWYNSATATIPLAAGGNTTTTTILPTYHLGKNEGNLKVSPANKEEFVTGSYIWHDGHFMVFNNSVPVLIETAKLYIGGSNRDGKLKFIMGRNFTVTGGNISYIPEGEIVLDIFATDPTPQSADQPLDPTDQGAVFLLNLPVFETGEHFILVTNPNPDPTDRTYLFRNNGITSNPYPIGIPGIFTFTNNSVGYANPPGSFQNFYYLFYDMKISFEGCPAPARKVITSTTVNTPAITLAGNVFTSNAATGNQWLKDGVAITGQTGTTFTATQAGNYSTQVTINGCTISSNIINFIPTSIPTVDPAQIGLIVSPVPAKAEFRIQLQVRTKADLDISLFNTAGQPVYHSGIPGFIGQLSKTITPGKIAAGVYYLQIIHDRKRYIRKVIIVE